MDTQQSENQTFNAESITPNDVIGTQPPVPESYTPPPVIAPKPKKKSILLPLLIMLFITVSAVAYFSITAANRSTDEVQLSDLVTPKPFFLTVDNLSKVSPAVNGELLVTGKTIAGSTVAIVTDADEAIVEADPDGTFESSVVVDPTSGLVRVVAYADDGTEKNVVFTVSESSTVLGKTDTKETAKESKNEPNVEKVKVEKVEKATKEVTVQAVEPAVKKVKTAEETKAVEAQIKTFVAKKVEAKPVKKLGVDKIHELNTKQSTDSAKLANTYKLTKMEAKQATAGAQLKRQAISGVITSISGNAITLSHQTQRDRQYTVYMNALTAITVKGLTTATAADLQVGMRITAAGVPAGADLLASKIHVIPGKATGVFKKQPVSASDSAKPSATESAAPTATPSARPTTTPTATPSATPVASTSANLE